MIRGSFCLAVIIIAAALVSPALVGSYHAYASNVGNPTPLASLDPVTGPGASTAFNYTLSSANIFTNATSKATPAVNSSIANPHFKWFSTINNTKTGSAIQGTAFNFTVNSPVSQNTQQVAWNLTIPKSNCSTCATEVSFTLYGTLTKGASENFTLTNSTIPIESGIFQGKNATRLPICTLASPTNSSVCGKIVQLPVPNKYIGATLTLTFKFGWNATASLEASIGEVIVESLDNTYKSSVTNFMTLSGNSPTSLVSHNATFYPINYNATNSITPWKNEVLNIYYPSGYNVTQIRLNQTAGSPISILPSPPGVPFEKKSCFDGPCSQVLIAINMSDTYPVLIQNSTIYITALTVNSISRVSTLSGGVATQYFTSGDTIGIKVMNNPSIENASTTRQTGTLTITFPPILSIQTTSISTASGGVFNFTLPSTCGSSSQLCATSWSFSAVFTSPYDLGNATSSFRIDLLQVKSFTSAGGNNALSVQGALEYGNGTAAPGVNATLFAIDRGTPINTPISNSAITHSTRLYISNVTLVNGVFTQGQSLIMLFTIVNPNATQAYNATVTIEHEWPGPQRHNVTVPVFLGLGDNLGDFAFTNATARTYEVQITFTGTGVQAVVTSVFTNNHTNALLMTQGISPVVPNRTHAGLFNITVTSMINNKTQASPNSVLSPTYAYVTSSLAPSRYLYGSQAFQTKSDGSFSANISSDSLLGATNLTVFVLARDASGIVVVNNLPNSGFVDSTTLLSNADPLGAVAKGEMATATLHLKSNANQPNGVIEVITVNLIIEGNGLSAQKVGMQTGITIAPGATQIVTISFTAPSSTGLYTLTFSSPEYGGALASQTLQVTILQSNLQILIPAAIGIVAAIIILGIYMIKKQPEAVEVGEKTKPAGSKPKASGSGNPPSKSLT